MKLLIRQCKWCAKIDCTFKEKAKNETKTILKGLTAITNCPDYDKQFREGDKVAVKMYNHYAPVFQYTDMEYGEPVYKPDLPYWEEIGEFSGVIIQCSHKKFYIVKLDEKVMVIRDGKEGEIEFTKKLAKDIKFIETPIQEEDLKNLLLPSF